MIDIELDSDGLVLELPSQSYISVLSFDVKVMDRRWNRLLTGFPLGLDLVGEETAQLLVAWK